MQSNDRIKRILLIPGLGGSGPEHWQTYWQTQSDRAREILGPSAGNVVFERVEQDGWDQPERCAWLQRLDEAVDAARDKGDDIILVPHSLAVSLTVFWARDRADRALELAAGHADSSGTFHGVTGALLVSPSDTDAPDFPPEARSFAPMPVDFVPPFRTIVVASADDPFVSMERAEYFAAEWKAQLVRAGRIGHINADSGLGLWEDGLRLLAELL